MIDKAAGIGSGLGAAAIWGGMYVASKVVLNVIPPFSLVSLRLIIGFLVLGVLIYFGGGIKLARKQVLQAAAVGWIGFGLSLGFQFIGTRLSTASHGALVTSTTPAFVLIFAYFLLKEPVSWRGILALTVSVLGVIAVIDPGKTLFSPGLFWGNLSLLAAAVTWALYSVLVRKFTQPGALLPFTFVFFASGLIVSLPAALVEFQFIRFGTITMSVILGVLYIGIVSTALAMYLWNKAFTLLPAGTAALTFFAQPVVGAGLGTLLLGEPISGLFFVGSCLIGLGIWFASLN